MKHKFNKDKILKFFKKRFKSERGVGWPTVLLALFALSLLILTVNGADAGDKGEEIIKDRKDPGKYAELIGKESVELDEETLTVRNETNKKILNHSIELVKIPLTVVDDTQVLTIAEELGVFKVKNKNTEGEDKKTETNLKNNGLPSDKLNVDIAKTIKAKIKNNSTIGTSPEETEAMMIKIMEDIEEEDKLFDSTEDDVIIDMVSHIEKILENNNKLADQKVIDLKTKLNRAESHKKYLEGIIEAFEEAEKEGAFQTGGISSVKADLEETNQAINNLETELQQYDDGQGEVSEDTLTDEETQDALTDEEVTEEITEEAIEEVITLNGTVSSGEAAFTMSMTINLGTGEVSGIIYVRIYLTDFEYQFEENVPISGSMDLETRDINAQSGDSKLTGRLSADGNSANGTLSSDDGSGTWRVSR